LEKYLRKEGMTEKQALQFISEQDPRDLQSLIKTHKPRRGGK
jgi:hypothetical protein